MKRLSPRAAAKIGRRSFRALRGAADLRPPGATGPSRSTAVKSSSAQPRSGVVRRPSHGSSA